MFKILRFCPADKTLLSLEEERHLGRKTKFFSFVHCSVCFYSIRIGVLIMG
jgi:hypothetical protein